MEFHFIGFLLFQDASRSVQPCAAAGATRTWYRPVYLGHNSIREQGPLSHPNWCPVLLPQAFLLYNLSVRIFFTLPKLLLLAVASISIISVSPLAAQEPPSASSARILLLPRKIVSGERATLAVLDVNGRLTPGVTVEFSDGDKLTTDATGRAFFVAPLNAQKVFASIQGRPGRLSSTVLSAAESPSGTLEVSLVPRVASLSDRIEISGHGFCGVADANRVTFDNQPGFVLAASPAYLAVIPPADMNPGPSQVQVTCGQKTDQPFIVVLVALDLEASSAPLTPGEHRTLTVHVKGSTAKVSLEARNLAPGVAELQGGVSARAVSSGGAENTARFELVGKQHGSFVISIRLISPATPPRL
jgi:hypothetical protein